MKSREKYLGKVKQHKSTNVYYVLFVLFLFVLFSLGKEEKHIT